MLAPKPTANEQTSTAPQTQEGVVNIAADNGGPPLRLVPLHGISNHSTAVDLDIPSLDELLKKVPGLSQVAGGPRVKQDMRMRAAPKPAPRMTR